VDSYRNVERATKYAILFIAITFLVFFLFEVLAALRIHPVQYAFVGLALCLFFLVLLSLSEFVDFRWSYLAAAATSGAMVVLYGRKLLGGGKRTAVLGGELAVVFTYLYIVLQLQDYSLLMGSVLLVGALAASMYLTRNVDWYSLTRGSKRPD
jgi:inner membrane protein